MHKFYAHSVDGRPPDEWQRLEEHLKGTAELAAEFAAEFECTEWGRLGVNIAKQNMIKCNHAGGILCIR